MKIRYIQSVGGEATHQAGEKDKSGKYVWHEVDNLQAIRYINADIAVYQDKAEYEEAKASYATLEARNKAKNEISETLKNLPEMKADLEKKKEAYKNLGAEIKALSTKVVAAEATITQE